MNAKTVRDALASLDGKSFNSREEAENALYVPFAKAKLSAMFTGEGHRDLFDRLERALWVRCEKGKWTYFLPTLEKFTKPQPETVTTSDTPSDIAFASELKLSSSDIELLAQVGKDDLQLTSALQNLINAGLVRQAFVLTSLGQSALNSSGINFIKMTPPKVPTNNTEGL
jgi:hypothetical protein